MRHITEAGLNLIKEHEGLRLIAYPDPATLGDPWTIGYGHATGVKPGDQCTQEQADQWLREDVAWAERCVERAVLPDVVVTDNEFDAMVSLAFNIGCANFQKSTVLRLVNAGNESEEAYRAAFALWNRAAGRVMAGLTTRREHEAEHFLA